jgi:hypothetical protein
VRAWSLECACRPRFASETARSGMTVANHCTGRSGRPFQLRTPCRVCGWNRGTIALVGGQIIARCNYGHYCYAVPRSDLSRERIAELERDAPRQALLWSDW